MSKSILATVLALSVAVPAFCAAPSAQQTSGSLFKDGELGLGIGTGYVVDYSASFQQQYTFNLAGGLSYFTSKQFGLEAWVPFYSSRGLSVQEVQAGGLLRFPLSDNAPVLMNLAPYIGLGAVYNWESVNRWAYIAKAGLECRLGGGISLFAEGQYRNNELNNWPDGQISIFGGLKLIFF